MWSAWTKVKPLLSPQYWGLGGLLFLLATLACGADTPKATPPPTLADALRTARPPRTGLVLCVGAEKVPLPPKTVLPDTGASVDDVADAFGREMLTFGSVQVLAPPTMTVLNTAPPSPDIDADLRPTTAFQLLAASLNDAQWVMLTSDGGLGLPDLDTDAERSLFHALFPQGRLRVATDDPELAKLDDDKRPDVRDVSDQIDSVRLRLGQTAHLYLHDAQGATIFFSGTRPDAGSHMVIFTGKRREKPAAHGVALRAIVPNTPKYGDFSFRLPALHVPVPLEKSATVGALVDTIRAQTGLEIYADPHYASRTVTVVGSALSAPAKDVLQALALCVCGTYRKVGPAFVLTDDLEGVGARRLRLAQWEEIATASREHLTDPAGQAMLTRRAAAARTLSGFGDPLALTPAQLKAVPPDMSLPEIPGGFMESKVAFQDLTPAQQDWASKMSGDYLASRADHPEEGASVPDLSRKVDLSPYTVVQAIVPGVSGPVTTHFTFGDMMMLYWPGEAFLMARIVDKSQSEKAYNPKSAPPLAPLLKLGKRRALVGYPRTAADVDALLLAMHTLGLNELYLDVFSDGQAHVPGSVLSSPAPPAGNDILTEALTRGPKLGIAIDADMSLLSWGDAPPPDAADLTILGETSADAAVHAHQRDPSPHFDDAGKPVPFVVPPVAVSPSSHVVQNNLTALVHSLAAHPGLSAFMWEDGDVDDALGYTDAARLAFLRVAHSDPVDITPQSYLPFDVSLPEWDNADAEGTLSSAWDDARQQSSDRLLTLLRQAVPPSLPVLRPDEDDGTKFVAEWRTDTQKPPRLPLFPADDPDALAQRMSFGWKKQPWPGYVLDFDDPNMTRGPSPLSELLAAMKPPAPK